MEFNQAATAVPTTVSGAEGRIAAAQMLPRAGQEVINMSEQELTEQERTAVVASAPVTANLAAGNEIRVPEVRRGKFIKKFDLGGLRDEPVVCFEFWELNIGMGCPFQCAYCFLQYSPYFRFHPDHLRGVIYDNLDDFDAEISEWIREHTTPQSLIVGELQDGLAFEDAYFARYGESMATRIYRLFKGSIHTPIFLSKSDNTKFIEQLEPQPNFVWSWSINTETVFREVEVGTAPPQARIDAAKRMKALGWRVRYRISPMLPLGDWRAEYMDLFRRMDESNPELVTVNGLLASKPKAAKAAAERNGRNGNIFDLLTHFDGAKWRIDPQIHQEMLTMASQHFGKRAALCKELSGTWQSTGTDWNGCHCIADKKGEAIRERFGDIARLKKRDQLDDLFGGRK